MGPVRSGPKPMHVYKVELERDLLFPLALLLYQCEVLIFISILILRKDKREVWEDSEIERFLGEFGAWEGKVFLTCVYYV